MAVSKSARQDDNQDYSVVVEAFPRQQPYSSLDRLAHTQQVAGARDMYKARSFDGGSN